MDKIDSSTGVIYRILVETLRKVSNIIWVIDYIVLSKTRKNFNRNM